MGSGVVKLKNVKIHSINLEIYMNLFLLLLKYFPLTPWWMYYKTEIIQNTTILGRIQFWIHHT